MLITTVNLNEMISDEEETECHESSKHYTPVTSVITFHYFSLKKCFINNIFIFINIPTTQYIFYSNRNKI